VVAARSEALVQLDRGLKSRVGHGACPRPLCVVLSYRTVLVKENCVSTEKIPTKQKGALVNFISGGLLVSSEVFPVPIRFGTGFFNGFGTQKSSG
jgi:hypothetical protein